MVSSPRLRRSYRQVKRALRTGAVSRPKEALRAEGFVPYMW